LEVLKWARHNGCPWDSSTLASAIRENNLEILHWAFYNGCPCDDDVFEERVLEILRNFNPS